MKSWPLAFALATGIAVLDAVKACTVRYRPRVIMFGADPIPATPTGKVKRAVLAQRFNPLLIEELDTALRELVAIAEDRWRHS